MMIKNLQDTVTLSNGVKMPGFGLGVYKVTDDGEIDHAVKSAIAAGYRMIDTAAIYQNEEGVGKAIKESGVPREEIFITSKVWNDDQGYESTLKAFDTSLEKLGLEYIDLYLIHWAVKGKYVDTWKALEKLYKDGKVKAIGVSNFNPHHIEDIKRECEIMPMVNQIELHPYLIQEDVRAYCKENNIQVESWSPLARGRLLDHPVLQAIAEQHGKTTAQVILRWNIQHGIITIPKSSKKDRIVSNADIFNFELSSDEMKAIDGLNKNERTGKDPDNFQF